MMLNNWKPLWLETVRIKAPIFLNMRMESRQVLAVMRAAWARHAP